MSAVRIPVRAAALAALALAGVACGNNPPAVSARLASPVASVAFSGITTKAPAQVKPYFAVASSLGDELRFIDQYDLIVVVGPGLSFPLSVSTDTRPVLLASASLGDGGADVLAAVSSGRRSLQIVNTWAAQNVVAYEVALDGVLKPDAQITGLVGVPARAATATTPATPARIAVTVNDVDLAAGPYGAATGKLVAVEFDRAQDGSGGVVARAVDPVTSTKALGFRASDLALEPDGLLAADGTRAPGTHLYVATVDPVAGTTYGVAQIDTTSANAADWTVTALDARGPTAAVTAGWVDDRVVDSTNYCSTERFAGSPHLEVVAALHPSLCGEDQPVACGLVTLDPATGALALDPAAGVTLPSDPVPGGATPVPAQPYRAPMPIAGLATHITILNAPSTGSPPQRLVTETDSAISNSDCPTTGTGVFPLFRLSSGSGTRYTSAMAIVTTSDGRSYEYDLARWGPTSSVRTVVDGNTRVQVTAVANYGSSSIGLWTDTAATPSLVTINTDAPSALSAIQVWPGFTDADVWSVTYQGALSDLQRQPGLLVTGSGAIYAAYQVDLANGRALTDPARFLAGPTVSTPALGVHVGDLLEVVDTSGAPVCVAPISAVLTPAAATGVAALAFPAGALRLDPADPGQDPAGCLAPLASATGAPWRMTVRAAGLVLTNNKLGYLGRPALGTTSDPADGAFAVAWADETALAADTTPAGQEKLALARKARRLFYPVEGPCPPRTLLYNQTNSRVGCYYGYPRLSDPLQPGPIIRFRLGLPAGQTLARGDALVFTTQSGFSQTFRVPLTGGTRPTSVVPFDWASRNGTSDHASDPIRYLVTYLDDQIVAYAPGGTVGDFYLR